jgi:hypothetical protein
MRIAIVGAGAVGARAARQLVSMNDIDRVDIHEVDAERQESVVASLGERAHAGGGEPEADVVILASPSSTHPELAARAIRSGHHVVSVADGLEVVESLFELDHEARERGVSVVLGAGFSPGLSCVLARHAAAGFEEVHEIHIARAGTGGPACARQHHAALGGWSLDWRDGGWVRRRAGSGRELCWFPDPVAGRDCYRAALPDALLLVPAFPAVDRVTVRLAANRRDRLTGGLPMLRKPHPEGGPGALRVEVRGRRDSGEDTRVLGVMDRPAVAAGAVAALTAVRIGSGAVVHPGACGLASLLEPLPFLRDLRDRGIRAAVFEGA